MVDLERLRKRGFVAVEAENRKQVVGPKHLVRRGVDLPAADGGDPFGFRQQIRRAFEFLFADSVGPVGLGEVGHALDECREVGVASSRLDVVVDARRDGVAGEAFGAAVRTEHEREFWIVCPDRL